MKHKGTVKFFNQTKGFGFIADEDSDQEYFVHITEVTGHIQDGDAVEFDLKETPKGMNATGVKAI